MEIPKDKIKGSIASLLAVLIIFSAGLYYLGQKRMDIETEHQKAIKLKIEADMKLKDIAEREKILLVKENTIQLKYQEQEKDKELSDLTLKFIDEVSSINFLQQCGDDPEHNTKVRKAKAILALIEAKATKYGRKDIVNKFVKIHWSGLGAWVAKCKS